MLWIFFFFLSFWGSTLTFLSHSLDTSSGNFVRGSVHLAVRFTLSSALSNCCSPLFIYIYHAQWCHSFWSCGDLRLGRKWWWGTELRGKDRQDYPQPGHSPSRCLMRFLSCWRTLLSRECPYPTSRLLFALLSTCRQPADPCVTSVFSRTCCRHLSLSFPQKCTHTHQKIRSLSLSDGVCLSVPASLGTTLTTFYGASSLNNDENFSFILFF